MTQKTRITKLEQAAGGADKAKIPAVVRIVEHPNGMSNPAGVITIYEFTDDDAPDQDSQAPDNGRGGVA